MKAIKFLPSEKAPGSDAYLLRTTKQEELQLQRRWQSYFTLCGEEKPSLKNSRRREAIPQEFKDVSVIHLFKWKGNPQLCDNLRGIPLLSIAGKVLARVLLNRLNQHLEQAGLLPESQCGFRKDRETIDMISFKRNARNRTWTST